MHLSPLNPYSILQSFLHLSYFTLCQSELYRFLPLMPTYELPENSDGALLLLCLLNTHRLRFEMIRVAVLIRSRFSYV